METVMVDMDNVITDGLFSYYIEEFYDIKLDFNNIKEYAFVQEYSKEKTKEFWEFVKDKPFYGDAPLFEGCYDVLKLLNKFYNVFIVTSYMWNETIDLSSKNLKEKYEYLQRNLPFIKPEKYIFSTYKNFMNFDIKIDDKISNLDGASTKLLYLAWHNKDIPIEDMKKDGILRVNSWFDIEDVLLNQHVLRKKI